MASSGDQIDEPGVGVFAVAGLGAEPFGVDHQLAMTGDPVTGQPMPGPIVTRFSPSTNLGDFDIASLMLARRDGPFDWFVSGSWSGWPVTGSPVMASW